MKIGVKTMPTYSTSTTFSNNSHFYSLSEEIQKIKDLPQMGIEEKKNVIWPFMNKIGDLFLEYFQHHIEEAKHCGEQHKEILLISSEKIENLYISHLDMRLDMIEEGEWIRFCQWRTNVEAFNQMFSGITQLETEDIDEKMKKAGNSEGISKNLVPHNIPESHWWWFC